MAGILASIGECMVEFAPEADGRFRRGFAGDSFNTAWTLKALLPQDHVVRYVTALGDDRQSEDMLAFLAESGLDCGYIARIPGGTAGLYVISLNGAERSFSYWRATSAARRLADDPARLAAALEDVDIAYFSGITLAILDHPARETFLAALAALRARGGRVAFDPNIRLRLWPDAGTARSVIEAGYRVTDIALPSFDDEAALFGDGSPADTLARIAGHGVADIIVKDGARPCHVRSGGADRLVASRPLTPVDTSGAGDAFNAGYLGGTIAGLDPCQAAIAGHEAAALAVMSRGALADRDQLSQLRMALQSGSLRRSENT